MFYLCLYFSNMDIDTGALHVNTVWMDMSYIIYTYIHVHTSISSRRTQLPWDADVQETLHWHTWASRAVQMLCCSIGTWASQMVKVTRRTTGVGINGSQPDKSDLILRMIQE